MDNVTKTETDNFADGWKKWKDRYDLYSTVTGCNKLKSSQLLAVKLCFMGDLGYEIYKRLPLNKSKNINDIKKEIQRCSNLSPKNLNERCTFFKTRQKRNQTVNEFADELKSLSSRCNFLEPSNMIRDILICGISDDAVSKRIMNMSYLTLEEVIEICNRAEIARNEANANQSQDNDESSTESIDSEDSVSETDSSTFESCSDCELGEVVIRPKRARKCYKKKDYHYYN